MTGREREIEVLHLESLSSSESVKEQKVSPPVRLPQLDCPMQSSSSSSSPQNAGTSVILEDDALYVSAIITFSEGE